MHGYIVKVLCTEQINVHRSAISSVLPNVDGIPVGQLPVVKQLMKGILLKNPPLSKYSISWDIDIVLGYLSDLPENKDLSLSLLGKKFAILLALAAPKRVSEISRFDRRFMTKSDNSVIFTLPGLSKTQRNVNHRTVRYDSVSNPKICVLECLREYEKRTVSFRPTSHDDPDPLLRSSVSPHNGLSPQTVSNWIKFVMKAAGVDTSVFLYFKHTLVEWFQ